MLHASASSVKTGDKVIVIDHIPPRVLKEQSYPASFFDIRDGTSNTLGFQWGVSRGVVGRVMDTKAGRVVLEISGLKHERDVIEFGDFDFEKYFAEWV